MIAIAKLLAMGLAYVILHASAGEAMADPHTNVATLEQREAP